MAAADEQGTQLKSTGEGDSAAAWNSCFNIDASPNGYI